MAVPAKCFGISDSLTPMNIRDSRAAANAEEKIIVREETAVKTISKNNTIISVVIVMLILCDLASLAVLFARLSAFSGTAFQNVIPLTESNGITKVTQTTRQEINLSAGSYDEPQIVQLANTGFRTKDNNTRERK